MEVIVIFFRHNLQILNGVVSRVAVNVVNHLSALQVSAQRLFHCDPVVHHVAFAVTKRVFRDSNGAIRPIASISDKGPLSRLPRLMCNPALKATKGLGSLPCGYRRFVAMQAVVSHGGPKPPLRVATVRAYGLLPLRSAAVRRVKSLLTNFTNKRNVQVLHGDSLPAKRYCEIAVMRLAQDVLDFGGGE